MHDCIRCIFLWNYNSQRYKPLIICNHLNIHILLLKVFISATIKSCRCNHFVHSRVSLVKTSLIILKWPLESIFLWFFFRSVFFLCLSLLLFCYRLLSATKNGCKWITAISFILFIYPSLLYEEEKAVSILQIYKCIKNIS